MVPYQAGWRGPLSPGVFKTKAAGGPCPTLLSHRAAHRCCHQGPLVQGLS